MWKSLKRVLVFLLLVGLPATCLQAVPLTLRWVEDGHERRGMFDLKIPEQRAKFLEILSKNERVTACASKANLAVEMMRERDEGTPISEHMAEIKKGYEEEKPPWHIYVDLQRVVNDVHRQNSPRAGGGYQFTDENDLWERQFVFCTSRGIQIPTSN